jgi:hypothetical protein
MTRRRTGKGNGDWALENLHPLYDLLTLESGNIRTGSRNPAVRIRSIEDAAAAWEANREHFMRLCVCDGERARCAGVRLCYRAGSRPWAWWRFDAGYAEIPEDQAAELERLGYLSKQEKEVLDGR